MAMNSSDRPNAAQRLRGFLRVPGVSGRRRRQTQTRQLIVESLEPRYLLSGDGLLIPPVPVSPDAAVQQMILSPAALLAAQVTQPAQMAEMSTVNQAAAVDGVKEVIFVDASVKGKDALIQSALQKRPGQSAVADVEVVVLDANSDGVQQISAWLKQHSNLQAIHLITHGDDASIHLGSTDLDDQNLADYATSLTGWKNSLAHGADLLLYGCDVAEGERGQSFIRQLADLTGTDVGASTNATGAQVFGGDWVLESQTGAIEHAILTAPDYGYLLSNVTPTLSGDFTLSSASAKQAFATATSLGAQLDANTELSYAFPMVDLPFAGLIKTNDGRTLGDVLAFKTSANTTVLDDYLASGGTTANGLMQLMGDYLNGRGRYSNLESVVDATGASISMTAVSGGIFVGDSVNIDLKLSRDFLQRFGFDEQLKPLGFDFQAGQGIPLVATVDYNASFNLTFGTVAVNQLDAQIKAKSSNFSVPVVLGVVDAVATGTVVFDTGVIAFNSIGTKSFGDVKLPTASGYTAGDNLFSVASSSSNLVSAAISFDITGSIGSTSLATIAGGTPHVDISFGGLRLDSVLSSSSPTPTLTGQASLYTGQSLRIEVAGATYDVTPDSSGNWSLNLQSAIPVSGTLALATGSDVAVTAKIVKTSNTAKVLAKASGTIHVTAPTVDTVNSTSTTPVLSGSAFLGAGQTLEVAVGGAVYVVTPASNHLWTLDLATAVKASGTLTLANNNSYNVIATVKQGAVSQGTASATLSINSAGSNTTTSPSGTNTVLSSSRAAVQWSSIQPAPMVVTKSNVVAIQALSSLDSVALVHMQQDLATYLQLLRDSGKFDALLPFTNLSVGNALDFSAALNEVINQQLAITVQSGMAASKAISPVLSNDVAFDLQLQRTADDRISTLTIGVTAAETAGFTHVNQLATLINQKISAALNGWLALDTTSRITVTETLKGGLTATGLGGTNEEQTLAVHAASGTYTLKLGNSGTQTSEISVLASPIEVQNALEAVLGAGNVIVTGRPRFYQINFVGALAGTNQPSLVWTAGSSLGTAAQLEVFASELSRGSDGTVWGKINIAEATPGSFKVLRVAPSFGVSGQVIAAGSDSTEAVYRLTIVHAGSNTITVKNDSGVVFSFAANASTADILSALVAAQPTRTAMSVADLSGDYAADNGTRVLEIGFGKITATNVFSSMGTLTVNPLTQGSLAAQAAIDTRQQAALALGISGATNEIQRLSIANATGGSFVLGVTLDTLLYQTGNIAYGCTAADIKAALVAMYKLWKSDFSASEITVTAVAGKSNTFDIEFGGRWAGKDVPQLKINSFGLTGSVGGNYSAITNLGFAAGGQDFQTNSATSFVSLNDMMERFAQAVETFLPGITFSLNPRYDAATHSFMFDVKLAPTSTRAVPLAVTGSVGQLSGLTTDASLDLTTQAVFEGTIGFDLSQLNTFALRAGGAYTAAISASATDKTAYRWNSFNIFSGDFFNDAPFSLSFNGENYDFNLTQAMVNANTSRQDLVNDLQGLLDAMNVEPGGVLKRLGYSKVGQAIKFGISTDTSTKDQLVLTVNAPVEQVKLIIDPNAGGGLQNPLSSLLGFKAMVTFPAPKAIKLPTNGQLSAAANFDLVIDQSSAVSVSIPRDTANASQDDLIADINAAFAAKSIAGHAYLGTGAGGLGFSNLGQVVHAILRNGQIELVTQSASIASLQIQVSGNDPATSELGFTPGQFAKTSGAYVFMQDVHLSGSYSAVVHGQSGVTPADVTGSATLGMLDLGFGKLAADYQGSMQFDLRNGLTAGAHDRVGLNDLFDSVSSQAGLLGIGGTLTTADTVTSSSAPYQSNGQLLRDVGLKVTVGSLALDVVVKRSATLSNTSVADLATDVDAAIHAALVAKLGSDPYASAVFVSAADITVNNSTVKALKFTATSTTLTLAANPSQIYDSTSGILLLDLPLTVTLGTTGKAADVTVRAANTTANSTLSDLVTDVDNSIRLALMSARNNTTDAAVLSAIDALLARTDLVTQNAGQLVFASGIAGRTISLKNFSVAGRLLQDDFISGLQFLDKDALASSSPTGKLIFSGISISTPAGIVAANLNSATSVTIQVDNMSSMLAGDAVQATTVIVPSDGLGTLTPFAAVSWDSLKADFGQLGGLLGSLGDLGAFGELGRALPILGTSVSEIFDFSTRFSAIESTLAGNTSVGLTGLAQVLASAFGIDASSIALTLDTTSGKEAFRFDVPYRVVIDQAVVLEQIFNDPALLALLSPSDKAALGDLLGSLTRLKDTDGNAKLNLHADMTFNLAFGIDLSNGANKGKLFLLDHAAAGAAGFAGDTGTYATLNAFTASASGMAFESTQGIYSLGINNGTATISLDASSGLALQSDAKDGAADGRLYLGAYGALGTTDATALKKSNFSVVFDGSASANLPMTLSVSDDLGQLAMQQIDGFLNPLPLGTAELSFLHLGESFAAMGGASGFLYQSSAEGTNSATIISSQVKQSALPVRPATGNGTAVTTPEGAPVDTQNEGGLPAVNPNPYYSSTAGQGSTTATSTSAAAISASQLFSATETSNPSSAGFDVSLILPNLKIWQEGLTKVLESAIGDSCDPTQPVNGPLIFLLRDPTIIVNTVDTVLESVQKGLDAFSSVLDLPIIGDQLRQATQFVADLRGNVVGAIKKALDDSIDVYGGLDNALRMMLFKMLEPSDTNHDLIVTVAEQAAGNPFLNFLQDYNGDKLITPDDIVVEYVAGLSQPEINPDLADYLGVNQSSGPIPTVLPGQRTAWVTSGINTPKLDSEGNPVLHDDGTTCYVGKAGNVILDSSLQAIVDDMSSTIDSTMQTASDVLGHITSQISNADRTTLSKSVMDFATFVIDKVKAGYNYQSLLKDVFGAGVIAATFTDVLSSFKPSSASISADAATLKYNLDHNLTGSNALIPMAVFSELKQAIKEKAQEVATDFALGASTAIQFRMHLGQTYTPNLDLSFQVGVPGLNLKLDGGIGLNLKWDFYLGFGVDINDGFYVITNMPGTAGIGEKTVFDSAGVARGTVVNSAETHIDNLWLVGKPTFTPAVKELQATIDVYLLGANNDTSAARLNAELFVLNGTMTDNWDGWIKDNDTGVWGSGTDSMNRISGSLSPTYGRTETLFDGDTGKWGSRTRLQLNFAVDLKDVGLFGISALSGLTNGRLTYSDLRNAKLADLIKVDWDAQAQVNLHMELGVSLGGEGYLPTILGDFHMTWKQSNENQYVQQIQQFFTTGYDKLFHPGQANIWMTDVYIDAGTFFTRFLNPIVSVIQDVTDPIMPVINALTTPIPGLSDLMGRDYSALTLASDMSALFGGVSEIDFVIAMVNLLDVIDHLPTNTDRMLIPVTPAFIISGTKDRKLNLAALPSIVPDKTIDLPYVQLADVKVEKDGYSFGLKAGVGWKDDPATTGTNEGQTSLLKVFQGQTPDLKFDFSLTGDAVIPAPYVEATPVSFTIDGIYKRGSTTDLAVFQLKIKAGWPELKLSDILNGNMAPRFDISVVMPDIDLSPNILPRLLVKLPTMKATVNGIDYVLLQGGTQEVEWPALAQNFVNTNLAQAKTLDLSAASVSLSANLPDFLLPLPYQEVTAFDFTVPGLTGNFKLKVMAGWKDMWLSDLLRGDIAPGLWYEIEVPNGLDINTQVLPKLQVNMAAVDMSFSMGSKTWSASIAGGVRDINWPNALSGFVNTSNVQTLDLTGLSFDASVDLGTIHGFLPTIQVEWPTVHWIGLGKDFTWTQTQVSTLGWSSVISDAGLLAALIDPGKTFTIKLPDIYLPSISLTDILPNIDWTGWLPSLPSLPDINISLPDIDMPGQQTVGPQDALNSFKDKLKKPGSALAFPILDDPVGSVINLLTGKPADLMTFTPQNLTVKVGFRVSYPVYPPLYVGIGGEMKISASLTLGFDTYGISKFFNSHNLTDIFDGFYVSDNIVNGIDKPEITLNAKLVAFAELNAFIVRGGVEGGIKLTGTLDLYDEDKDGKMRASEILAAVSEDPLDLVEMHLKGSAYIAAYVDVFLLFDWERVWEWTFMDVTLFEWEHDPASKKPVLGSMADSTLTLHMGSTIGSIDGQDAITKSAADRKRRSTDDGNEEFTLTGSGGQVNISAKLTNGQTYTKSFSGVSKVEAYAGAGDDLIDASALDRPVLFIAGSGNDTLKGGSADDVLIGSDSGTAKLYGGGGNDLLIARGGTTTMEGGTGNDTYRFLGAWGTATVTDTSGANMLDFSRQTLAVTVNDASRQARQGAATVTWDNATIDLVKGGSGGDILDFSGDSANLLVTLTDTNRGWVKASGSGMNQTDFGAALATGVSTQAGISGAFDAVALTTDMAAADKSGFGFRFVGFENIIGGQGSDVFRVRNGASVTGSLSGAGSVAEVANARNTLDFSEYTTGVVVNEEGDSAFGTGGATNIQVRGFHNLFGGTAGDRLSGDGSNNLIVGNDGSDALESKAGHDLLVADTFVTYQNLLSTQTRPTSLSSVKDYLSLQTVGAAEFGAAARNWIWKGQTIESQGLSSAGKQTLKGGSGNDIILGSTGGDVINIGGTGEGNDTILSDLGKVVVDFNYRSALSATSFGNKAGGNDLIYLGSGNNLVIAGNGKDTIYGADTADSQNIILADNGTVQFRTAEVPVGASTKLTFSAVDGLTHLLDYVEAPIGETGGTGSDDIVSLANGSGIVLGGAGSDTISFAAGTSTGNNTRFISGDHARIDTDAHGGVNRFRSLDTLVTTGGADTISIGSKDDLASRDLGRDYVIGGMGNDTILVSAAVDATNGGYLYGAAHSADVIVGDNGEIQRWDSISTGPTPNLLKQVFSTNPALGGNDQIVAANGDKVVVAGFGTDTVTIDATSNSQRFIAGDNGQLTFDTQGGLTDMVTTDLVATTGDADTIRIGHADATTNTTDVGYNIIAGGMGADSITVLGEGATGTSFDVVLGDNGEVLRNAYNVATAYALRDVHSTLLDLGGNDTITAANGDKVVVAGFGTDTVTIDATSNSQRFIAGDNGQLTFDTQGGLTDLVTTDLVATTGDADTIRIGHADATTNTTDVGYNIIAGGMGVDSITVLGEGATGTSFDVVLGDNGEVHRNAYSVATAYALRDVHSTLLDLGGNDTITAANGDKVIVGGYGSDEITIKTFSDSHRYIAGDNAQLTFDTFGGLIDFHSTDTQDETGGADKITLKDLGSGSLLGENFIIGGMGSDQILVTGKIDPVSGKISDGTAESEDILLGDNGMILRTEKSSAGDVNRMLQVVSTVTNKGGDDIISTGDGGKVIIGGYGADTILARHGDNLVAGDNAQFDYDAAAKNGILRQIQTTDTVIGAADSITLEEGFKVVLGGAAGDSINIIATGLGIAGSFTPNGAQATRRNDGRDRWTTGIDSVAGLDAASALRLGRSGRYVIGDNARVNFDDKGGLTDILSTDAITSTGGTDDIVIGKLDTAADLGYQVVVGGVGSDTINIRASSTSQDVIFGDNLEYKRKALDYKPISYTSLNVDKGGDDRIVSGSGVKVVVGGFGDDTVNLNTVAISGEATPSNHMLLIGDSGAVNFDLSGTGYLGTVESIGYSFGGMDTMTVGDGDVAFIGGYGADTLAANSTQAAFRIAAGDNARFTFAQVNDPHVRSITDTDALEATKFHAPAGALGATDLSGVTEMLSLDTTSTTGDIDRLRFGMVGGVTGDMGIAIMMGGMGGDTLTVTGEKADSSTLIGDNARLTRNSGRSGNVTSFQTLLADQGAGDTLETVSGWHLLSGGQDGDTIRAGSGQGVVFGDGGQANFGDALDPNSGKVQFVASVGLAQGGNDTIELGSSSSPTDGDKVVVGGYGADTITIQSQHIDGVVRERTIAGDNASISFDGTGHLLAFATQDPDISTGGNDSITLSLVGNASNGAAISDYNVLAGGVGSDTVQVFASAATHDVMSGDNLDYRRANNYADLFAENLQGNVGGNDTIRTGAGYKLIFGGAGSDRIDTQTVAGDTSLVFGDSGSITFDPTNKTGLLLQMASTFTSIGGNDTINLGSGKTYVMGGYGSDNVTINAADAVTRYAFGDNGQIDFHIANGVGGAAATNVVDMAQTTGNANDDPLVTLDTLNMPSVGTTVALGGTGVDVYVGSAAAAIKVPETGSVQNPESATNRVVSYVTLGENGDLGVTDPAMGVKPASGSGGTGGGTGGGSSGGATGTLTGAGDVAEDGLLVASGRLAYPALTGGYATFAAATTVGVYGSFKLDTDGAWTYTLSNGDPAVQGLLQGEVRNETFQAQTVDGSLTTVSINITGQGDAAVISTSSPYSANGVVTEDVLPANQTMLVTNGVLAVADADAGQSSFSTVVVPMNGAWGNLTIDTLGNWIYRVDNAKVQSLGAGQVRNETFTVSSVDGSVSQLVTVSINGANDPVTGSVAIVGNPAQGQTLTVTNDLADADLPSGLVLSYQWLVDGVALPGATNAQFTIGQDQVGKAISVQVSYTDSAGTVSVGSAATAPVANINDLPQGSVLVTGSLTQGGVLTASHTLTDADGLGTIAYQWFADGVAIDGATGNSLLLAQGQVGKAISVRASYVDGFGTTESVDSLPTSVIANVNDLPSGAVSISGTPQQGQTLSASNNLVDADGLGSISYQWYADGQLISGAVGTALTLTQAEVGKAISVRASYTDALGTPESVSSTATSSVVNVNDPALIDGAASGQVSGGTLTEDSNVPANGVFQLSGHLTVSDPDGQGFNPTVATGAGALGQLSFNVTTGEWIYSVNNQALQPLTSADTHFDTFTISSADGTAQRTIVITLHGADEAPAPAVAPEVIAAQAIGALAGSGVAASGSAGSVSSPANTAPGMPSPVLLAGVADASQLSNEPMDSGLTLLQVTVDNTGSSGLSLGVSASSSIGQALPVINGFALPQQTTQSSAGGAVLSAISGINTSNGALTGVGGISSLSLEPSSSVLSNGGGGMVGDHDADYGRAGNGADARTVADPKDSEAKENGGPADDALAAFRIEDAAVGALGLAGLTAGAGTSRIDWSAAPGKKTLPPRKSGATSKRKVA